MLSVIADFASNTKVSSQCPDTGIQKNCKQTHYTTFSIKSWIPVSSTGMTPFIVRTYLTFTLWSCRYPEQIRKRFDWCDTFSIAPGCSAQRQDLMNNVRLPAFASIFAQLC
ncbi:MULTISPECIES: hypothetical protein [Wolbachia]|uniref:Uncharacterized protein n=1 Tax=Wolbachia pipientis TaxID=955 RepID=A0A7G5CBJ4_WOLPI|nr:MULTISPECIES: hypothetical protein [Wolbachia]MDE5060978.1 hypothetical protein [Wolbachia endosymbiont of Drosophila nikananu]QMV46578.1 hypothetical protein HC356_04485 [Wolbachia pipientis]